MNIDSSIAQGLFIGFVFLALILIFFLKLIHHSYKHKIEKLAKLNRDVSRQCSDDQNIINKTRDFS